MTPACSISATRISMPETPSFIEKNFCAALMEMNAKLESYSYIPVSKIPTTLNSFILGMSPTGVMRETGETIDTMSPEITPIRRDSSLPRIMLSRRFFAEGFPFSARGFVVNCSRVPAIRFFSKSETVASNSGLTPRTTIPETLSS